VAEVKEEEKPQASEVKWTKAELTLQKMQEKMVNSLYKIWGRVGVKILSPF
jgi:hypothetical protein